VITLGRATRAVGAARGRGWSGEVWQDGGMSRARVAKFGGWGLVGLFVVGRVAILFQGVLFTSFDSSSYARRPGTGGSLVSLLGHAPRLWGVPLFDALFGSDPARTYGQWTVATIAWAGLAVVVSGLLRHPLAKLAGTAVVLAIALLPQVDSWDFAILSESLSISLGVATLALVLRWAATGSRAALVGTVVVAIWWTFTRPDIRVFTAFLVLAFALLAWRMPARRRAGLVAGGVLLVGIGWCSAVAGATQTTYETHSVLGRDEGIMYQLRTQVFPDPAIKAVFVAQLGLPSCPAADAIAAQPAWQVEAFSDATHTCPALYAWIDAHRDSAMTDFARADPRRYAGMTGTILAQTLGSSHYAKVPAVLPGRLGSLVFPRNVGAELWGLAGALLLAGAAVLVTRARVVDPVLTWGMLATAAVCLVSAESNVVFGVGEFWRFGVQEAAGLRVAILVLFVVAADALLVRRSELSTVDETSRPAVGDDDDVEERETADADRGARGGGPGQG
jgi:hypothetical protein